MNKNMKNFTYLFLVLALVFGAGTIYAESGSDDLKEIEDDIADDDFLDGLDDDVKKLEDSIKDDGDFSDDDNGVEIEVEVEHGKVEIKREVQPSGDSDDSDDHEERERVKVKIDGVEVVDWRATETKTISGEGKEIEVSAKSRGRFLGFIPFEIRHTSTVKIEDGQSEVKVKFPWWHIFVRKNFSGDELANEIRESIESGEDTKSIVEKILDILNRFDLNDEDDDVSDDNSTDDNS